MQKEVLSIRRIDVLREYDIKDIHGKQVKFSISFVKKNGELVFLPSAVACGLPYHVAANRQRGVIAVDKNGDKIGHVYPVCIDNIVEWNGKKVVL